MYNVYYLCTVNRVAKLCCYYGNPVVYMFFHRKTQLFWTFCVVTADLSVYVGLLSTYTEFQVNFTIIEANISISKIKHFVWNFTLRPASAEI